MPETIHVLLTDYGRFGWGVSSPQLPELVGGRDTYNELVADLDQLLTFGGAEQGVPRVIHLQTHVALHDGDELLIRVAEDEKADGRRRVSRILITALRNPVELANMLDVPRRSTGEVLFVCTDPTDTLGWINSQLTENDAGWLAVNMGVDKVQTLFVGYETADIPSGGAVPKDMGWTADTTINELIKARDMSLVARDQLLVA